MVEKYDRGSAVIDEVEFKKYTPYIGKAYFDPLTFTITVFDPSDVKKIDAANLIKDALGKYYYVIQTLIDWEVGEYKVQINSSDPTYDDVTVDKRLFELE